MASDAQHAVATGGSGLCPTPRAVLPLWRSSRDVGRCLDGCAWEFLSDLWGDFSHAVQYVYSYVDILIIDFILI